jgi:hypothetical protein
MHTGPCRGVAEGQAGQVEQQQPGMAGDGRAAGRGEAAGGGQIQAAGPGQRAGPAGGTGPGQWRAAAGSRTVRTVPALAG